MSRGPRSASLAAALIALAFATGGCSRAPGLAPVSLVQVRASDLTPTLAEAGIEAGAIARTAAEAIAASGFRIDEGERRSYRAVLEVVAVGVVGAPPTAEVVLELSLEQTWAAAPALRRSGRGRAPLAGPKRQAAWREALRQATAQAASALALDLRALAKPPDQLIADLSAGDPRARERAARALASKGVRRAVRVLAPLVRDPDPAVARAVVDTLAAFRDPGSACVLIDAAQAGDVATTLRLIPVLAEVGGADVEGYLLTLRSGHADAEVRRAAGEALLRVHAHHAPPAPTR